MIRCCFPSNDCGLLVINSNEKQRPAPVPGRVDAVLGGEHRLHLDSNVLSSDLPSHLSNISNGDAGKITRWTGIGN